jgi:hypothetical protein
MNPDDHNDHPRMEGYMKAAKSYVLAALLGVMLGSEASAIPIIGLTFAQTSGGSLVSFDSATPGTIDGVVAVTGLNPGASLRGIDFRPATGGLHGLSSDNLLYRIDTTTGVATLVGATGVTLNGSSFGFDFNPTVDRIRITSNTDENLRLNPNNGVAIIDSMLTYAVGDPNFGFSPFIAGSAYTNSFPSAVTTTLYDIDRVFETLVIQTNPNGGILNTVGALGFETNGLVGFDISADNLAFASLTAIGGTPSLFSINLTTGAATLVGGIGSSLLIADIAIAPPALVPEPGTTALLLLGLLTVAGMRVHARKR